MGETSTRIPLLPSDNSDHPEGSRYEIEQTEGVSMTIYTLRDKYQKWFKWALSFWSVFTIGLTFYIFSTVSVDSDLSLFGMFLFGLGVVIFIFSFGATILILMAIAILPLVDTDPKLIINGSSHISSGEQEINVSGLISLRREESKNGYRLYLENTEGQVSVFNHEHVSEDQCLILNTIVELLQRNHGLNIKVDDS